MKKLCLFIFVLFTSLVSSRAQDWVVLNSKDTLYGEVRVKVNEFTYNFVICLQDESRNKRFFEKEEVHSFTKDEVPYLVMKMIPRRGRPYYIYMRILADGHLTLVKDIFSRYNIYYLLLPNSKSISFTSATFNELVLPRLKENACFYARLGESPVLYTIGSFQEILISLIEFYNRCEE